MQEKSLKITGANTTFFNKITNTLTKILIPTKISLNGMFITLKRNNMLKSYEYYKTNEKEFEERFEQSYTNYLEAIDKYIMDSIYKKVKNGTASEMEKNALSKYYEVTSLKENEYVEYKYRKQKYLLELDYQGIINSGKEKIIQKYNDFYITKMDALYKGILKNYSIRLADLTNIYDTSKEWIYTRIFYTLEDYIQNIFSLKIKNNENGQYEDIMPDFTKFEEYTVGKLDVRDNIEKNMVLIGISRKLFTHSLPLVVAEQCYEKLLKDARTLVQDTKIATKRERAYSTLINLIEEYNVKLLSTKVYWDNNENRDEYKKFWNKYKKIEKLKENDFIEYVRQKEILFMKNDMKKLHDTKIDYSKIIKYYKRKLVDLGAMKQIQNSFKSQGKYTKNKVKENV